ncbi:MAG: T9SS type A sorting domain-containing protein [Bacteroidales bacterium]|nr:T9SS type A sorting domain-containing protein [Bacteroidales bacterium]MDD4067269.1 T9SS type A sorting domain-containing protein [Bacteroidales bacterium]MDD4738563.1 T9SS type A sorting domain-containing protein [Bacteroidales bacterium]
MKKFFISFLFLFIGVFYLNAQTLDSVYKDNNSKILKFDSCKYYVYLENKDSDNDGIWLSTLDSNRAIVHIDKDLNLVHYTNTSDGNALYRLFKADNKLYSFRTNYYDGTFFYYKYMDLVCHDTLGNLLFSQRIKNEGDDTIKWQNWDAIMLDNTDIIITLIDDSIHSANEKPIRFIRVDTSANVLTNKTYYKRVEAMDMIPFNNEHFLLSTTKSFMGNISTIYFINNNTLEIEDSINGRFAYNMRKVNDSIVAFNNTEYRTFNIGDNEYYEPYTYLYLMNTRAKYSYSIEDISNPFSDSIFYGVNYYNTSYNLSAIKNNIDFTNTDSIYSFFAFNKNWLENSDQILGTEIINFNSQGNVNFFYKTPIDIGSMTLKATSDGGLIIPYEGSTGGLYLYKFMPNGLNSILNIETKEKVNINVYPNPAKDYISVDFDSKNFNQAEIELYDMQGKLVKKAKLKTQKGNRLDISSLKAGTYTYNIILNGNAFGGMMIVVE